ncbi:cyclic GMP-AMP synthase-like [Pelobates fuscus]|uniref:cyclic GMP-AMP synthase-like n=1 Tax=Pelobates fuscus TaxID=191477 RepID=UPI002FE4C25B
MAEGNSGRGMKGSSSSTDPEKPLTGKKSTTRSDKQSRENNECISREEGDDKPQDVHLNRGKPVNGRRQLSTKAESGDKKQGKHKKEDTKASSETRAVGTIPLTHRRKKTTKESTDSPKFEDSGAKPFITQRKSSKVSTDMASQPQTNPRKSPETPSPSRESRRRLKDVVEKLKLKMDEISAAAQIVNNTIDNILKSACLKEHPIFKNISQMNTGSYYEGLKISKPNEFDIMLKIPVQRVELIDLDSGAFYKCQFKRLPKNNPWNRYADEISRLISPNEIITELRDIIENIIKSGETITLTRETPNCPAITIEIENTLEKISVDLVLALEVQGNWPEAARDGMNIDRWLGTKKKNECKYKNVCLVAKQPDESIDKVEAWRLSFSHIEKEIIKNHGNAKTCCERKGQTCCRKACLKLLKCLLELIKNNSNEESLDVFCSYHAKTAFLHYCAMNPLDTQWLTEDLQKCFDDFVGYFLTCLKDVSLPNFFIPCHNLFDSRIEKTCFTLLHNEIECEKNQGYPIFDKILLKTISK